MADRQRRLAIIAIWVLCAAGCACIVVFPVFARLVDGYRYPLGMFTGWTLRAAWVKTRK
jgi:hypothetical protein